MVLRLNGDDPLTKHHVKLLRDEYAGTFSTDDFRAGLLFALPVIFVLFAILVLKDASGKTTAAGTPKYQGTFDG